MTFNHLVLLRMKSKKRLDTLESHLEQLAAMDNPWPEMQNNR